MKNVKIISEKVYYDGNNKKVLKEYKKLFVVYRILFYDNTFYIGTTTDFDQRCTAHNSTWKIRIKSIKKLLVNEEDSRLEKVMLKKYIKRFGLKNCRNKDLNPSTLTSTIETIDYYCSDLITSIQKQCLAFNYKRTTVGVSYKDAASRFGVSEISIKRINSLYNELNKDGYASDFDKMYDYFESGKVCHPSQFEWLNKRCSSFSNAIKQLNEYRDSMADLHTANEIDITEVNPETGEFIKKEENFFMNQESIDTIIEENKILRKENEELKVMVKQLINKVEDL